MSDYTVGIVGTGPHPDESGHDGYSMGYRHARSFQRADGCRLGACTDIVAENATAFGDEFGLDEGRVFTDARKMLDVADPEIVGICTPPSTHRELVETCANHDSVRAVHCEKPMADTFGGSRRLVEVCEDADVQLTINLQNRCSDAAAAVKRAIDDGTIGELERIELGRQDLLQTGLHHIDLANYVLDDEPVEWILGQIDYPEAHVWYTNMPAEVQSLGMWAYESGVHALCSTGAGSDAIGAHINRFIGTDGEIEFQLGDHYRIRTDGGEWETVHVGGDHAQNEAIATLLEALESGSDPIISGERALGATEVVFGIWESARKRGRVSPPLEIEDNPLSALIESEEIPPRE
ncbi:Gfo/Idh/MocA family protein (plasmid) [Haloferacaceae archaeon DSL9]